MSWLFGRKLDKMNFEPKKFLSQVFLDMWRLVECFFDIFYSSAIAGGGDCRNCRKKAQDQPLHVEKEARDQEIFRA